MMKQNLDKYRNVAIKLSTGRDSSKKIKTGY